MPIPAFKPAWWLPGPHLQTMWGKLVRRVALPPVTTERWSTEDDDDVTVIRLAPASSSHPRVLFLHGLEGTAESHYVKGFFNEAAARGWGVDLLLFRTCDGRLNRAPRTYHSGEVVDPTMALQRVVADASGAPVAIVGVSLGGNVLLRLLATLGSDEASRISAAVAISTPYDLGRSCAHLQQGFSRVYQWHFVRKLRPKALAKIVQHPGLTTREAVERARTFHEFDDAFTSVIHGFRDAADYYERCSSVNVLGGIRVPTLLLSARDDPFHPPDLLDVVRERAAANPFITLEFHKSGGHVGFVTGSFLRPRYYAEWRAADFIAAHCRARTENIDQQMPVQAR